VYLLLLLLDPLLGARLQHHLLELDGVELVVGLVLQLPGVEHARRGGPRVPGAMGRHQGGWGHLGELENCWGE